MRWTFNSNHQLVRPWASTESRAEDASTIGTVAPRGCSAPVARLLGRSGLSHQLDCSSLLGGADATAEGCLRCVLVASHYSGLAGRQQLHSDIAGAVARSSVQSLRMRGLLPRAPAIKVLVVLSARPLFCAARGDCLMTTVKRLAALKTRHTGYTMISKTQGRGVNGFERAAASMFLVCIPQQHTRVLCVFLKTV